MAKYTKQEQEESAETLREILTKPGVKVYASVKAVSRSGMSRSISFHAFYCEGGQIQKRWLDYHICRVLSGVTFDKAREAVKVSGCGMDMAFHVLYDTCGALELPDDISQQYGRV